MKTVIIDDGYSMERHPRNRRYREGKFTSLSRSPTWEEDAGSPVADVLVPEDEERSGGRSSLDDVSAVNIDPRAEAVHTFLPKNLNKPRFSAG